jgi:hypothetical protein
MATLAVQFDQALRNIEPQRVTTGDDAHNAKLAHAEVRGVLQADTKLYETWGIKPKLIGSYARDVSIRRVKDVDVFCRLTTAPPALMPGDAMTEFERVLEAEYDDRCERQHRSFKIEFPDFDLCVDVVPAKPCGEHWQVPSRDPDGERGKWVETNPLKLNELTSQLNGRFPLGVTERGMYVPTVKLIRQVRRHVLGDQPGGLFLELMTYHVFDTQMTVQSTVAAYLSETLGYLATFFDDVIADGLPDPTMPGKNISTKASATEIKAARVAFKDVAKTAKEALETEEQCAAARLWQQVLGTNCDGEVFELPSYCSATADTAGRAAVPGRKPGADRVPAGRETYA